MVDFWAGLTRAGWCRVDSCVWWLAHWLGGGPQLGFSSLPHVVSSFRRRTGHQNTSGPSLCSDPIGQSRSRGQDQSQGLEKDSPVGRAAVTLQGDVHPKGGGLSGRKWGVGLSPAGTNQVRCRGPGEMVGG